MIRVKRPPTAVAWDTVRPTEKQIAVGVFVVPIAFVQATRSKINWRSFEAEFMGVRLGVKHIDGDNRIRLALKRVLKPGDLLKLAVDGSVVKISKIEAGDYTAVANPQEC